MSRETDRLDDPVTSTTLWRNRSFLVLWVGDGISMLGSRISFLAFPLLVLDLTHSPAQAGFIAFLESLPNVLFNLPAGALADRWNRKRVMILSDVGRAILLFSIPASLWLAHLTLVQLGVVAFGEGTLDVLFSAAAVGAIPALVPAAQLPAAFGQVEATSRGSVMVGGAVAGLLYQIGRGIPFLADSISYAASVVSLTLIPAQFQTERTGGRGSLRADIVEGLAWVWRQPFMRMTTLLVGGSNMIFAAMTLGLIILARRLHASPAAIGLMFSVSGVGGVLGAVSSPWLQRRLSLPQVVIGINWVWALLTPLLLVAPNPLVLGCVFGLMVFVGPIWNVVLGAYQTVLIPDELRSRVGSVERFISWGSIPLGSALGGIALQGMGAKATTLALFAAMLVLALAATVSRAIRDARPAT